MHLEGIWKYLEDILFAMFQAMLCTCICCYIIGNIRYEKCSLTANLLPVGLFQVCLAAVLTCVKLIPALLSSLLQGFLRLLHSLTQWTSRRRIFKFWLGLRLQWPGTPQSWPDLLSSPYLSKTFVAYLSALPLMHLSIFIIMIPIVIDVSRLLFKLLLLLQCCSCCSNDDSHCCSSSC